MFSSDNPFVIFCVLAFLAIYIAHKIYQLFFVTCTSDEFAFTPKVASPRATTLVLTPPLPPAALVRCETPADQQANQHVHIDVDDDDDVETLVSYARLTDKHRDSNTDRSSHSSVWAIAGTPPPQERFHDVNSDFEIKIDIPDSFEDDGDDVELKLPSLTVRPTVVAAPSRKITMAKTTANAMYSKLLAYRPRVYRGLRTNQVFKARIDREQVGYI
ncbi:hypothetical protein Poli38472_006430 [Pythium oligandrum]|uniref:Uncharacterized protein n=1 Tax=Pythium oligandrum TaxID=41045 RepID=A0A8K1C4W0_PYTOL|nr:hypothetical protein Poli38472_006430 [Pythium oligandrum]|eukprot:TMW56420.1 hypothetical protein Poli38472_006430 [Pythium oligandrum]